MKLRPVTLTEARRFVAEHHRHNVPPQGWMFGVGLCNGSNELLGVAIAGHPVARLLMDGKTVEITRVCTVGEKNANSKLYGAICRAAEALGYDRAITYTLVTESGASLKAAGFQPTGSVDASKAKNWSRANGRHYDTTIWGQRIFPVEDRIRWERTWKKAA